MDVRQSTREYKKVSLRRTTYNNPIKTSFPQWFVRIGVQNNDNY